MGHGKKYIFSQHTGPLLSYCCYNTEHIHMGLCEISWLCISRNVQRDPLHTNSDQKVSHIASYQP